MANPGSAVPFLLRRQNDVNDIMEMTTTTETFHGVLRIEPGEQRPGPRLTGG